MKDSVDIRWHDELDSTNSEALRRISGLDNLSVVAAFRQTAGRGQRGNSWHAAPGENLTFSLVLKFGREPLPPVPGPAGRDVFPPLPARGQFAISRAATLGVAGYLADRGIESRIKWPNDLYVRNRKICGMLVENVLDGGCVSASVVGIGLNVNQRDFPPSLVNPTSMALLTGREYSLVPELESLCGHLLPQLELLASQEGPARLEEEYARRLYRLGELHEYVDCATGTSFEGTILGVSDEGLLLLETRSGERRACSFKEISYVI